MTEWWQQGYPGGPLVAVKGFPRPLYYPGNPDGHPASTDGSDCEAYKRTIARAGRWPWQAYDQAFSKAFALGKAGGNVSSSGVAGTQRQGKITPASGYVGQQTFNLLRSIRIPQGLPNAGQAAMDARSVELINQAWDRFKGNPQPEPPGAGSAAQARLKTAQGEVGVKESPANSNNQKYGAWYGMNGVPWCAIFCTWADQTGQNPYSKSFVKGNRWSYVPYIVSDAQLGKNGLSV